MFKYKVTFLDDSDELEFESRHHIAMLQAVPITIVKACFIYFDDADVNVDLMNVKSMEINGKTYKLQTYEV